MNFLNWSLSKYKLIIVVAIFLCGLGVNAFIAMPRSLFPEINYPRVVVEVNLGFTPLEVMEWNVAAILEREIRGVPGVRLVKSSSSRGMAVIDIYLSEFQNVDLAVQRVNAKLAEARSLIPAAAEILVRPVTADAFPAAEYCFTSQKLSSRDLRTFVEFSLKPQIMVIPGIFDSKVLGGDTPEFSVELDPRKLSERNITIAEVTDRLRKANAIDFLGPIDARNSQTLAFGGKFLKSEKELGEVVVASALGKAVRIADLGQVSIRNSYKTKDLNLNGKECVALDVLYQGGINQQTVSKQVAATVANVAKSENLEYRSWDLNDFTDSATNAVIIDLLAGMGIIALITFLFLRNFHLSLVALLSMPVAACATFLVMAKLGLSINLMTLGGFTAAVGLVVDNSVIVLETFYVHIQDARASVREALRDSLSIVMRPLIFGTLTIVAVFAPIANLSGVSGMFFAPMATVHGVSLLLSILIAVLIVPSLILATYRRGPIKEHQPFADTAFARLYANLLSRILALGKVWTGALLIIPLLGFGSLHFAKTGFLPEWDEGDIVVDFRAVTPLGLKQTADNVKPLEEFISAIPEVDFFIRKVGTGIAEYNHPPYLGEFIVRLKKDRKRSVFEIQEQITEEANKLVKDFEFDLFQILPDRLNDLSGSAKPIVIYVRGAQNTDVKANAEQIKEAISKIRGIDSPRIEEPADAEEILFQTDQEISRALEVDPSAVDENLRFNLFSVDVSSVQIGAQNIPIRLRSSAKNEQSVGKLQVFSTRGGLQRADRVGKVSQNEARIEATHIDGTPVVTITAEISGRDLGSVVKEIKGVLNQFNSKGVFPELSGDYVLQRQSFLELTYAFGIGIILIFITALAFSSRFSVAIPLVLGSLVPPTIGLVGCVLLAVDLDVSSLSGLISVTGISVANSFMAFGAIESLPGFKQNRLAAVRSGMLSRLRPILMTNLAAMAGFLPIALGMASGDEILRPFSIAIIFGLVGALYATLFLMPTLYFKFARLPESQAES